MVGCEFSGTVRRAFRLLGHDAWSCDLLPAEDASPYHLQCDVLTVLCDGWDLGIFHPPCTHLAVSGARYWAQKRALQDEAVAFFCNLLDAPIPMIAVENPIGIISPRIARPAQIIQPWHFGEDASKATCLWLINLPLLTPYGQLPGDGRTRRANQTASGQNKLGPSPDRWKERSRTYPGIADAFASQWGL